MILIFFIRQNQKVKRVFRRLLHTQEAIKFDKNGDHVYPITLITTSPGEIITTLTEKLAGTSLPLLEGSSSWQDRAPGLYTGFLLVSGWFSFGLLRGKSVK
jgi:hypothetical protein